MNTCLITGTSGFAGSNVLKYLFQNTDWNFICPCSWRHKGTPERLSEAGLAHSNRVKIITHDLTAPFTERTLAEFGDIHYIINIASESHVDRSITDPVPFIKNNVDLTLTLLELARLVKPKLFIQFSTDEVYGVAEGSNNHKEWSSIVPSNPYSASKACQEAIAIAYWRTYGVPLIITNTMNLWGERQDKEKYISKLISTIHKGEIVTVHGSPNNIGSRFYINVKKLAEALLFIIKKVEPVFYNDGMNLLPPRYNIVGRLELNNLELAQRIAKLMNRTLKYEFVDFHKARSGHDRRYALDGSKLTELGWTDNSDFDKDMDNLIRWSFKNRLWM